MKLTKSIGLLIIITLLSVNTCFAEGQGGMAEFFLILFVLETVFYIAAIGGLILLIRKLFKYKNSLSVIIIAFGIGTLSSALYY